MRPHRADNGKQQQRRGGQIIMIPNKSWPLYTMNTPRTSILCCSSRHHHITHPLLMMACRQAYRRLPATAARGKWHSFAPTHPNSRLIGPVPIRPTTAFAVAVQPSTLTPDYLSRTRRASSGTVLCFSTSSRTVAGAADSPRPPAPRPASEPNATAAAAAAEAAAAAAAPFDVQEGGGERLPHARRGEGQGLEEGGGGVGGEDGGERETRDAAAEEVVLDPLGEPREKQRLEVAHGTFHEFTAVNKNGGKLFEASRELLPANEAAIFPGMKASCLTGREEVDFPARLTGRVTMVGLFHRQFGYSMLPSWREPFEAAFGAPGADSSGQVKPAALQVSFLESWALRFLKPLLAHAMGRDLSPEKKAAFFYRFGATDELRKALGIENRLTLYVLLIDQKGRVRWRGTGKGTPGEVESLIRCARQLAEGKGDGEEDRAARNHGGRMGKFARRNRG